MIPSQAREWLLTLPPEQREPGRLALKGTWGDGFGCGAARLPALNPFEEPLSVAPTIRRSAQYNERSIALSCQF